MICMYIYYLNSGRPISNKQQQQRADIQHWDCVGGQQLEESGNMPTDATLDSAMVLSWQ